MRALRLLMRFAMLVGAVALSTATSCMVYEGIAVTPAAGADVESVVRGAVDVATRTATRYALTTSEGPPEEQERQKWIACYDNKTWERSPTLFLCAKIKDQEVHFLVRYIWPIHASPPADSVRRQLLADLQAEFGQDAVRECKWQQEKDPGRSGCAPVLRDATENE